MKKAVAHLIPFMEKERLANIAERVKNGDHSDIDDPDAAYNGTVREKRKKTNEITKKEHLLQFNSIGF